MRLLLDTHVVLWWFEGNPRITDSWSASITNPDNEVYVSAVVAWEIEVKKRLGKLHFTPSIAEFVIDSGFSALDLTIDDGTLAGSLDWDHKDPFDRMLVAQARERGLVLVTADESMVTAPGVRVLT